MALKSFISRRHLERGETYVSDPFISYSGPDNGTNACTLAQKGVPSPGG